VSKITASMRDVLIDHLDGCACQYLVPSTARGAVRSELWRKKLAQRALCQMGYLLATGRNCKVTVITDAGRAALSKLLGEYADALLRASYDRRNGENMDIGYESTHIRRTKPAADEHEVTP
jgi:hypothetical protein